MVGAVDGAVLTAPVTAVIRPRPNSLIATWGPKPFWPPTAPSMAIAGCVFSATSRVSMARVVVPALVWKVSVKTMSG